MAKNLKPASRSLRDFGQYQRGMMLLIFIITGIYWALARYVDDPIFDETQYGPFVMAFKAETWLMPMFFASGLHLLCQVINGDPRLPPWATPLGRTLAASVLTIDMALFAYGGLYAPYFDLYFAYTGGVALITLWFTVLGAGDLIRGVMIARGRYVG